MDGPFERPQSWNRTHLRAHAREKPVDEVAKVVGEPVEEKNTLSIPWVVAAAILCGVGIFLVSGAVIRLAGGSTDWTWWIGVVPTVIGFMMLMSPRAGSQGPH